MTSTISLTDFQKLDIRVGKIIKVENHPNANKLYILQVDFGSELGVKKIVAGLKQYLKKEDLENKKATFIVNLTPIIIRGVESQGMCLVAGNESSGIFSLLSPDNKIEEGTRVS